MPYYHVCPECGSNLDPGETCECILRRQAQEEKERSAKGDTDGSDIAAADRVLPRTEDGKRRMG